MKELCTYFKSSVVDLKPYSSARDEYEGSEGIFLDANENALYSDYNRYPDPYQWELKALVGKWRNVAPSKLFIGNGSDEIIDLLMRATCTSGKDRILSLDPSYGMYRVSAMINEIALDLVEIDESLTLNKTALLASIKAEHKLIFICSPNNPNGGLIDSELIEFVLKKSNGLVVVDEAYIDFSASASWVDRLNDYPNLIVMQTFSKSLGAAGIRVGMAFMHEEMITLLNKIKPPYNISIPNQEVAIDRLNRIEEVEQSIAEIINQRVWLRKELNALEIVEYIFPSEANFLLVRFQDSNAVFSHLKKEKIIVRDRSRERHCANCLRISIGTSEENVCLIKSLQQINEIQTKVK